MIATGTEIRVYGLGSRDYNDSLALREEILRKPLGLAFDPEKLKEEATDYHIGIKYHGHIIACLVLTPDKDKSIRMRQVAVINTWQHKGLGRRMVRYAERYARDHGFKLMFCHAREDSIPFYTHLDFKPEGEPFIELGITHQRMEKGLL